MGCAAGPAPSRTRPMGLRLQGGRLREDGCGRAAGSGSAHRAQNPGGRGAPGGAGEKQPEGPGGLQALARSGAGTRVAHYCGATASPEGRFQGPCGRIRERSVLAAVASGNSRGASRLGPSWWCWPGACSSLPLPCPLQEVSSPCGS